MMNTQDNSRWIGMFDSGVGGLTVMQEVVKALPRENILYFGDTARLPYGEKSRDTIIRYAIENTIFLMEQKIKMLVIPCNTVTSVALDKLKQIFNIPIVGVIEPGVEKVVQVTRSKHIAVLGTRGTINSGVYQREIALRLPNATIHALACPLFVPFVEEDMVRHPAAEIIVKEYLAALKGRKVDTILLGCTHYPLLRHLIQKELGDGVQIVDSASTCAEKVGLMLSQYAMHNTERREIINFTFRTIQKNSGSMAPNFSAHPSRMSICIPLASLFDRVGKNRCRSFIDAL